MLVIVCVSQVGDVILAFYGDTSPALCGMYPATITNVLLSTGSYHVQWCDMPSHAPVCISKDSVADLGEPVTGRTAALHQRDRQEIIADEHRIVLAKLSARDREKTRLRCERYQYLRSQYVAVILAWHANEEALPFIATFVIHDLCTYVMNK